MARVNYRFRQTAQQCETHYFNTYINVPTAPLPDMSRMLDTPVVKDTSPMEEGISHSKDLY
jgi:hypothetical protein